MITGSNSETKHDYSANLAAFICLILNPIMVAIGTIAMRKMKKMHESLVSAWMNLICFFAMMIVVYAVGDDLSPMWSFDWLDWMLMCGIAIFVLLCQTLRYMALQVHEASALQSLSFLQPIQ